jgi:hypothetical protein
LPDDQNEHAQPEASQPSDQDLWNDYQAKLNESVVEAEQHLEVPAGTISSIQNDPDFIAIVKMYAVIEPILNDLIVSWQRPTPRFGGLGGIPTPLSDWEQTTRENFRAFVTDLNIRGRTGKIKLAKGLGLLAQHQISFIDAVAVVRNRYAHNVKNMHRSLADIVTELQRGNGRIVEHLTGINPPSNELLKSIVYYQLADYLSDALQTLRPPPRYTGLLTAFGKTQKPDDDEDESER